MGLFLVCLSPSIQASILLLLLLILSWLPSGALVVVVLAVAGAVMFLAQVAVVAMVRRQCLLLLLQERASGDRTSSCAFVARMPLAFFFLLPFMPLFLSLVWTACFFIFRGAVDLLPMLI